MLLLLPVGMNYRTERLPVVTLSLIGVNVLVYVASLMLFFLTGGDSDLWIYQNLWLVPAYSMPWMYLTSMFVHGGFFHLLGNMIFLFLFGCCVEDMIGRWKFLAFYLLGGLIAEIVFLIFTPEHMASEIPMGGASGAISACMGMYLLLRADSDIEFKYFIWFLGIHAGEFEIPAWIAISFWFVKDLFWMILGWFTEHHGGGTAFGAHVGGMLAGMAMIGVGRLIRRQPVVAQDQQPQKIPFIPPIQVPRPVETGPPEIPTIHLCENGVQSGPFTLSQIQAALANGAISPDAVYWSDGMADWQSVMELSSGPS